MSLLPEIKQASAEINKFVAQANIHQTIAPVDPAAFTDPADTMLLASRDPVIREVSVGMTGVEAAPYTVSGTPPLSLPNSLGEPLKAWSVELLPYQEGSGDPSPSNVRPIHGTDKLNMFAEESYDPRATPKAVITLPQTVYTGTIGSEGGESRWGVVDLGTLIWSYRVSGARHIFRALVDDLKQTSSSTLVFTGLCESYQSVSIGATWVNNDISWGSTNSNVIDIVDNRFDNVNDFYVAVTGVKLIYELATPTTFSLPAPTIPTPTGTATTWATAEDGTVESMEVTYYKSE